MPVGHAVTATILIIILGLISSLLRYISYLSEAILQKLSCVGNPVWKARIGRGDIVMGSVDFMDWRFLFQGESHTLSSWLQ